METMGSIHIESQATAATPNTTFSNCQSPIQRLTENFNQNFVFKLSFQYLLFCFTLLMSFASHIKKPENYRHWSLTTARLEPETL